MPTSNHTITVTINGTDRTALLLKNSLYIRTSISNDGDTATFTLRDTGVYTPNGWHTVTIAVNGTAVFGGYIVTKNGKGAGAGANKEGHWAVTCRDWSILLDQAIVSYGYTDTDDTAILSDLFSRYLGSDGFDAATAVANVKGDLDIYFDNITLCAALNQLAALCGAEWHIAPNKGLYWYATASPGSAAFNIDTVTPNGSTSFDVLADSVDVAVDETTIINRATVIGGERLLPGTADVFSANGTATKFQLSAKPNSINFVSYIIGGTAYYARSEDVGFEPGDTLRADGGNYDVLVNLENRYVTIRNNAGSPPAATTGVVVNYYPSEAVQTTVNSTSSQGEYGRTFAHTVYDDTLTSTALATDYAQRIVDEYAFGRMTVSFAVTEHGLLPGRLITLNIPALDVEPTTTNRLETEARDLLLQEDDDLLLLESDGSPWQFLIQEVEIYPVVSAVTDDFMIIAKVRAGKYVPSLFDTLRGIPNASSAPGLLPARRTVGKISSIANDLGEVRAGRAVFTDGGTASFQWDDYADHTGIVVGLEGVGSDAQGALYILQDGTVKAKVGNLAGLGSVGTVAPSGWGIWTNNGYFTGAINANSGQIGGWTIANNAIIGNGGTISTSAPPLNSSNPGVYMSTAGIYGYGSLGLTFALPADPAQRPIFSSGTILETVYEVQNAAVIRTGTTNPRVQIDSSGMFAYNPSGSALFTVDSSTGRLTASDGVFSGSVTASQISGGTVSGALVTAGTVSGGTVTGALVTGGTVSAVGGSVTMSDAAGLKLLTGTAFAFADQRFITWRDPSSDRIVAQLGGAGVSTANEMYQYVGTSGGTIDGLLNQRVYGTVDGTAGDYSEIIHRNSVWAVGMVRNAINLTNPLVVGAGSVVTGGSVYPATSNFYSLGGTANAWTALYLHDGVDEWRITINSSGVLTTVKV